MEVRVASDLKSVWMIIFFTVGWCVWHKLNEIIFKNRAWDLESMKREISRRALSWNNEWEKIHGLRT
ncbi:hypothetical protein PIB30_098953, partial [Stylosanthes scabra]|nr:hypothetical protein [Stylosanthes scabra]